MRQLATPGHRRPPRRLDPVSLAVAAGVIALALALGVSVFSLIDRYVGWVPIAIAVGAISLVCVLAFVSIGLADRRGDRR
jgi:predicted MFS family arabinose efflux permease